MHHRTANHRRPIRPAHAAAALALALATLGLQGCERGADSGATANPVAPGRPGTGNGVEVVAPQPTSIPESPQVGGNRGAVPDGVTGSGAPPDYPGQVQGGAQDQDRTAHANDRAQR